MSTTVDTPPPTVPAELFPEFCYSRRDRDDPSADRRPPLPPPRRPSVPPRTAVDKSSPPPPPATTATANIEDVIGRLRLDEARKSSAPAGDCGVRRVPRMGTRLCGDVTTPSRTATVDEPTAESPSTRLRPADFTLEDDLQLSRGGTTMASAVFPVDVGAGDRRPGVSRSTQTDDVTPAAADVEAYRVCADVMYTNRANLRHTIAVQQRLFRQQLADRQAAIPPRPVDEHPQPETRDRATSPPAKMEWIVRKRSDGSRYVTRRPVRSVRRSAAWVGDATTTDDDEAELPKTGRYWTRDQRRQHVAERRQREAVKQLKRAAACRSPTGRPQHGLAEELAAICRHRQTPLLSVATV